MAFIRRTNNRALTVSQNLVFLGLFWREGGCGDLDKAIYEDNSQI